MLAKVMSGAIVGLDGVLVEVEVDILPGLPKVIIVGLPDAAVEESSQRVRSAIRNSGGDFPMRRIVVNLAPADLKKAGPAYDLSIAVGVMLSSEQISADVTDIMFLGELSLDGSLRHTNGILPLVGLAKGRGISTVVVPEADAREASLIEGIKIIPAASLAQLAGVLQGDTPAPEYKPDVTDLPATPLAAFTDMADIKGQEHVKRALEVAAAGGHNMIFCAKLLPRDLKDVTVNIAPIALSDDP